MDVALPLPPPDPGRWRRRAVSVPLVLLLAAGSVTLLPALLPLALGVDGVRRRRMAVTRTLLMATFFLCVEAWGVATLAWGWLRWGRDPAGLVAHANRTQHLWCRALLGGLERLFEFRYVIEGAEHLSPGPFLLFLNHTSSADALLPIRLVAAPTGRRARYVLKQELAWDPCLDIAGHRLPNYFVRRGGGAAEIEAVQRLGEGLGPDDLVVVYPEGTRFTPRRRQRRIDELRAQGKEAQAAQAEALQRTLLPRPGGPLGLLEHTPGVDVVFCAHQGFSGVRDMGSLLNGRLVGQTVRVRFTRVRAADIPPAGQARYDWLIDQWKALDRWLGEVPAG
ncbi:MAG: 1-acyl-sn-glycerol-3-phosphate acyltransferase [Alphaproteobacteria bacterium]|nr:1-acyl-sn-glycerol-3-phosphate acyltransferase [Alphaproteobacteria bacterium]